MNIAVLCSPVWTITSEAHWLAGTQSKNTACPYMGPKHGRRQTYVELGQRRPVASVKAGIVQLDEFLPDLLPVRPFISHGLRWSCGPEARGKGIQSKCKQWMLKGRSKNVNTNTKIGMSYQNSPCCKHLLIYSKKISCLWTTMLEGSIMIYMCK